MVARLIFAAVAALALGAGPASAETKSFALAADKRLEEGGLLRFLVPRFSLKHGVRPQVTPLAEEALAGAQAAAVLGPEAALANREGQAIAVFHSAGDAALNYVLVLTPGAEGAEHAATFADWLTGEIGQRTLAGFAPEGSPPYRPGVIAVEVAAPEVVQGDADAGERLALQHCGRCHVVSQANRFGGIGSTPSFAALRSIPGWQGKFQAFWNANPHPSFTFVEGVTDPPDPRKPPHIAPVLITLDDIEAIYAYAAGIEPLDLGAPIEAR
jgi:hypothetical protein